MLSVGVSIVLYRTPITAVQRLIESLLADGAAHVYVVDNSPEEFGTYSGWQARERVSTLSSGGNVGYGRGHNQAITPSTALHDYHLVCNPDIEIRPGTLAALCSVLEERREVGLCMPRVVGLDGSLQRLCKRSPVALDYLSRLVPPRGWSERRRARMEMRDRSYDEEIPDVQCLSGCFMFFRSKVLAQLGGFDPRFFLYFEDFDLSRRASRVAHNLYYPRVTVSHAHAREHARSWVVRKHFIVSAIRYFNKWGWFG